MKIGIDASQISKEKTGIEHYTHELVKALIKADMGSEAMNFILYSNNEEYVQEFRNIPNVEVQVIEQQMPDLKWIFKVSMSARKNRLDYFISPSFLMFNVFFPRTIQIIHDIIPVTNPEFWPKSASSSFKWQLRLASVFAKKFVTNSNFTKLQLMKHFPRTKSKTDVIGTGLHEWAYQDVSNEENKRVSEKMQLPEKYLLSVGTVQPRKNYENCIRAFGIFHKNNPEYHYVIAGKAGWMYENIEVILEELNLGEYVHITGYVDEADLPSLYDQASALIFCPFIEGFGLPAIEAYSRSVPVVLSDIAVLREFTEGEDYDPRLRGMLFINPNDPQSIADGISGALRAEIKPDSAFFEQYSWSKVAKRLLGLIFT